MLTQVWRHDSAALFLTQIGVYFHTRNKLRVSCDYRQGSGGVVSGRAHDAVRAVFQGLLEAALRDAAAGAFEDEEEDEGSGVTTFVDLRICHFKLCNPNICER